MPGSPLDLSGLMLRFARLRLRQICSEPGGSLSGDRALGNKSVDSGAFNRRALRVEIRVGQRCWLKPFADKCTSQPFAFFPENRGGGGGSFLAAHCETHPETNSDWSAEAKLAPMSGKGDAAFSASEQVVGDSMTPIVASQASSDLRALQNSFQNMKVEGGPRPKFFFPWPLVGANLCPPWPFSWQVSTPQPH